MALFTDGAAVNAEELGRYETSLLDVLRMEQVPVDAKIALAQEACGQELATFVRRNWAYTPLRDEDILGRVVLDARLRRWIALESLGAIFSDAYSRQLNERYAKKQELYTTLAREARDNYFGNGAAMVSKAVPRPPLPSLETRPGPGTSGTYYVAVSSVSETGAEGAVSEIAAQTLANGSQLWIRNEGSGTWNVYVGDDPTDLRRQNTEPVTVAEWPLGDLVTDGPMAPQGQLADTVVRWQRRLRRG